MSRGIVAVLLVITLVPTGGRAEEKPVYRVGIARSAFREVPSALVAISGQPFQHLMKAHTGLDGQVTVDTEWAEVARDLDAGRLHFGVLQGHEYAWAREKYPDIVPLVCSVYRTRDLQAFLLVRYDCKAASLADLKGSKLALAGKVMDHVRLFLEKRRVAEMGDGDFGSVERTETALDAIHRVIDQEADLTVVDAACWSYFQKLYPGPSTNLKVLAASEVFPPGVLVYKKGGVPASVLKRFRDGLLTAHQTTQGSRMMSLIRLEKFELPPERSDDILNTCLKAYPPPQEK